MTIAKLQHTAQHRLGDARPLQRLHVLDAFRALAILAVLVCHYFATWGLPEYAGNLYGYQHAYPVWLGWGALGVEFFFIISGFVIFMTLERCHGLLEFWARRFARLYPAYVVAMALTFLIANTLGPPEFASSTADFLIGLSLSTPYVSGAKFVDQVYWSLVVELQFYIAIGIVYVLAGKRFATLWTLYAGATLACWFIGRSLGMHMLVALANRVFLLPYLAHFTLGIAFYFLYTGRIHRGRLLAALALSMYLLIDAQAPAVWHAMHAMMVVLFVLFLRGKLEWLAVAPLQFLGKISYSLYLVHAYIGIILIGLLTRVYRVPDLIAALGAAIACLALAYALTETVERPIKRTLLRWAAPLFRSSQRQWPSLAFVRPSPRAFAPRH